MSSNRAVAVFTAVLLVALLPMGPAEAETVSVVAVGDIASCDRTTDERTAELVDVESPEVILALGDLAYPNGSAADFADCYDPSWGRHKAITRPTVGNHEYATAGAAPYFDYFGERAGPRSRGWYAFDIGDWHVVTLNSNCTKVGCGPASEQADWLRADLAATNASCIVATMHHPRFTSGVYETNNAVRALWDVLYEGGADLVLSGHAHSYERFAPQRPDGVADPQGMRMIVAGTGGITLRPFSGVAPNSEVRLMEHGILSLDLGTDGYGWRFVDIDGNVDDAGTSDCGNHRSSSQPSDDPVTVQRVVDRGADDVEQRASGKMYPNSSDLELVEDGGAQIVGIRFRDVRLPTGAIVESAFLQFTTDEASTGAVSLAITGQAADDAAAFGSRAGDLTHRARTEASVAWAPPAWSTVGESGAAQRSPDLSPIVSEIVGRPGWVDGGSMVFLIEGQGRRTAESFEGSAAGAPRLIVTYRTEESPPPPPPPPPEPEPEVVTVERRISSASDDAESAVSGSMYVTSTDLELAVDRNPQTIGLRFMDLGIPRGAVIRSANVRFTTDEVSEGDVELAIRAQASDSAATFSTLEGDIATRPRTQAAVSWSPPAWTVVGSSGADQQSPDLAAIVAELVGRPGWGVDSDLVILIDGTGRRTAESYEGSPSDAALLSVTYEIP